MQTYGVPLASQLINLSAQDAARMGQKMRQQEAEEKQKSGKQQQGLAQAAQMGASMYFGGQAGSAPTDSAGNGFGLGGTLSSGEMGSAQYAGPQDGGTVTQGKLQGMFQGPTESQANTPMDNGYRSSDPYGLDYSEMQTRRPSLFTYGGSYGGASY